MRSHDPISFLPLDQPLSKDLEVRLAARDALHARWPLGPTGVKDRQVLFDEFKTGSAVARQVSSGWTAESSCGHVMIQRKRDNAGVTRGT